MICTASEGGAMRTVAIALLVGGDLFCSLYFVTQGGLTEVKLRRGSGRCGRAPARREDTTDRR